MGNAESSPVIPPSKDCHVSSSSDDDDCSSSSSSPNTSQAEDTSFRSCLALSSSSSSLFEESQAQEEHAHEEETCYQDAPEETATCSFPFTSRRSDPLLLSIETSSYATQTPLSRSFSSLCYPSSYDRESKSPCKPTSSTSNSGSSLARASSWTSSVVDDFAYTLEELEMPHGNDPTEDSDLRPTLDRVRRFWVVTTAALPWMTGTAVNPLLRAAHLSKLNRGFLTPQVVVLRPRSTVTLVIPWLESAEERVTIYGKDWEHATQSDQEEYIRTWLCTRAGLPLEARLETGGIELLFYPARLHTGMHSIFAMGDICSLIPADQADVCILEEPEHLNWYKASRQDWWSIKFTHVVGIGHTNYQAYVRERFFVASPVVTTISALMVRAYCHKLIKLSSVLQTYAPDKEVICNVHGIRQEFLHKVIPTGTKVYFIGKLLWAKGFDKLIDLQLLYRKLTGSFFDIDIFGSGPEQEEIQRAFVGYTSSKNGEFPKSRYELRKDSIPATFRGGCDHVFVSSDYKIFINPSVTEVLCTTTAEAIAMNKFVIVPNHPSNAWFRQFPNCLLYASNREFVILLQYAQGHDPEPLTDDLKYTLTWEAATERCLDAAQVSKRDAARRERLQKTKSDHTIAKLHYELGKGIKGDVIRKLMGGGPVSDQYQYEQQSIILMEEQKSVD